MSFMKKPIYLPSARLQGIPRFTIKAGTPVASARETDIIVDETHTFLLSYIKITLLPCK